MTREEMIDIVAETMVKTDPFHAVHGKQYIIDMLSGDDAVSDKSLAEVIRLQLDDCKRYNPDKGLSEFE